MNKSIIAAAAAIPLLLGACSKSNDDGGSSDDGFEMSIDLSDDSTKESEKIKVGSKDDPSKFSIKADGFSMDVDLPEITLDSGDFDLNNVNLYPGTKVTSFNIEDQKGDSGKVTIGFVSPTEVDTLMQWFETKMADEKFVFSKDGNALSGTTEEGDPFSLELSKKSDKETLGTLKFSEK